MQLNKKPNLKLLALILNCPDGKHREKLLLNYKKHYGHVCDFDSNIGPDGAHYCPVCLTEAPDQEDLESL